MKTLCCFKINNAVKVLNMFVEIRKLLEVFDEK